MHGMRYWPVWLPVPGRKPWRITDWETHDYVRNTDGKALKFEDGEKMWDTIWRLENERPDNAHADAFEATHQ